MKRCKSCCVALVLVTLWVIGGWNTGRAAIREETLSPFYIYTTKVSASLTIDENGTATCKGSIRVRSNDSAVSMNVQLQKKTGSTWMPVKTWYVSSDGGKYLVSLSENRAVSSGTYRVYVDGIVTDIDGNTEAVFAVSGEKTYP